LCSDILTPPWKETGHRHCFGKILSLGQDRGRSRPDDATWRCKADHNESEQRQVCQVSSCGRMYWGVCLALSLLTRGVRAHTRSEAIKTMLGTNHDIAETPSRRRMRASRPTRPLDLELGAGVNLVGREFQEIHDGNPNCVSGETDSGEKGLVPGVNQAGKNHFQGRCPYF